MQALDYVLVGLLALLVAGHIGINFVTELEKFLVAENLVLAILYVASIAGIWRGASWGYALVAIVALFSAGRVSRSIVGSRGEIGELAVQHIPLLAIDLIVGIIAVLRLMKP
ncbi:hypothetical protein PYJP_12940 [Pyrofollis japonicus]|uniref:hypothetical protein n=1 Tax=Pyrofollis japonicus TaxID=3060460 RepID=UPI00295AFA1F|nr:hypothetical protein [Pyrofollis japonicus]BEP17942.1 hypothetical protein PYJP_12940 [Pyrofollis japonicus]